jgi:predicted glutamine amidotransferase
MVSIENGAAQAAPLPSWWHLVGAPHALRVQAEIGKALQEHSPGHKDSWGIGWFDAAGSVALLRQTGSAADSAYYVFGAEKAADTEAAGGARTLIGHLRKASCGAVNSENAHPVRVDYTAGGNPGTPYKSILVAHNGTLREPLLASLRADLGDQAEARSDSDTVVLAAWLGSRLSTSSAPLFDTLADSLRELLCRGVEVAPDGDLTGAYTGINLLIAAPEGLFALRQFSKNPEYYTLFVRPMTGEESPTAGWLVASEPTDNPGDWEPIVPGELSFYSARDTSVRKEMVTSR